MIWTKKLYILAIYIFARTAPRFWQTIQNRFVSYIYYSFWGRMRRHVERNLEVILNRPPNHRKLKKQPGRPLKITAFIYVIMFL